MAIVKSQEGKFFDIADDVLSGCEVKTSESPGGACGVRPGTGGGSGAGGPGRSGILQIVINLPAAGNEFPVAFVSSPGSCAAPEASAGGSCDAKDVEAHHVQDHGWRNRPWSNCWRNI